MKQKQSRRIGQRRTLRRSRQIAAQADAEVAMLDLVVGAAEDTLTEHELLLQDINTTLDSVNTTLDSVNTTLNNVNTTLADYDSRLDTLETP